MQFGTNHLGHFLWTARLSPLLGDGRARVVNLSLGRAPARRRRPRRPQLRAPRVRQVVAYGQAKTANVLFARELERRLGDHGLHAYAVHPGAIATELGRHLDGRGLRGHPVAAGRAPRGGPETEFKSVDEGAATQVYAATGDDIPGGTYLADGAVAPYVADHASDDDAAARLLDPVRGAGRRGVPDLGLAGREHDHAHAGQAEAGADQVVAVGRNPSATMPQSERAGHEDAAVGGQDAAEVRVRPGRWPRTRRPPGPRCRRRRTSSPWSSRTPCQTSQAPPISASSGEDEEAERAGDGHGSNLGRHPRRRRIMASRRG